MSKSFSISPLPPYLDPNPLITPFVRAECSELVFSLEPTQSYDTITYLKQEICKVITPGFFNSFKEALAYLFQRETDCIYCDNSIMSRISKYPTISIGNENIGEIVTSLRASEKNINSESVPNSLGYATLQYRFHIAQSLVKYSKYLNDDSFRKKNALHLAAMNGATEIANLLLKAGIDFNATDIEGMTPLMIAVKNGYKLLVRLILGYHPEIDFQEKANGQTALMIATQNGDTEIIKAILNEKPDLLIEDYKGNTALDLAHQSRDIFIISLLKSALKIQEQHTYPY